MKVEIRSDSVVIDGYVNAVERNSKLMCGKDGAFVEKISEGAFSKALQRNKKFNREVRVLLNHNYGRQLASTNESTTKIEEDNIGLRCKCEVRDAEVVQMAKEGKLAGWSFGFVALSEKNTDIDGVRHREIRELELREVSILDNTRIPAYNGTSVEIRETEDFIEIREIQDEMEVTSNTTKEKKKFNQKFEQRFLKIRANL
ncbi:MAG: HK97 family phage prohead protease [Lachnospiraceae bacterium]|nr:HK97 family phage prohead protease [Lachnospiraceae bacterium]